MFQKAKGQKFKLKFLKQKILKGKTTLERKQNIMLHVI